MAWGTKKSEGGLSLTVKGGAEPSADLTPADRRLLRADCVFRATSVHPLYSYLVLGSSYPVGLPLFFPDLLITRRDVAWNAAHFEAYPEAKRVATALMKCLGMEDAAYVEMKVMGGRFLCGWCVGHKPRDWSGIIGHVLEEQRRQKHARTQRSMAEAHHHDLHQHAGEPMVKIVPAQEAGEVPGLNTFVPPMKARRVYDHFNPIPSVLAHFKRPDVTAARPQTSKTELSYYCLRDEARKLDAQRSDLKASGDVAALETWDYEHDQALENRLKHGVEVYTFLHKWGYDEKTRQ
ncbi:hypothetical protein FRC06_009252, partial [Ceratobasidium sp. 370]